MSGQVAAEKVGVASGDQKFHALPQQAVDKQFPSRNVLNLVKQKMTEFSVDAVKGLEQAVEVGWFQIYEPFVVEIDVTELHT